MEWSVWAKRDDKPFCGKEFVSSLTNDKLRNVCVYDHDDKLGIEAQSKNNALLETSNQEAVLICLCKSEFLKVIGLLLGLA